MINAGRLGRLLLASGSFLVELDIDAGEEGH